MGKRPDAQGTKPGTGSARPLAELLREIRLEAGVSIKEAGPQLGVSYTYLSKIENGVISPSANLLGRMAEYFGCNPNTLYAAAGRIPPDIAKILDERSDEAFLLLRQRFGRDR